MDIEQKNNSEEVGKESRNNFVQHTLYEVIRWAL